MADSWIDRANRRLNSEAFRALLGRVKYENLPENQRELADVIGVEATLKLCEAMGGNKPYFPGPDYAYRIERNQKIFECAQVGATATQLARQFGTSPTNIRRILREHARQVEPKQPESVQRMVAIIGEANARKLCEVMGLQIYIPNNSRLRVMLRDREVYRKFGEDGRSVAELAEEYQVTTANIYRIIHSARAAVKRENRTR